jgi:hypothetical protein
MVQEAWQELAHAFAFQQATLSTLASPIQVVFCPSSSLPITMSVFCLLGFVVPTVT